MNIKASETMWDAIETSIRETRIVQVGYDDRTVIGELCEFLLGTGTVNRPAGRWCLRCRSTDGDVEGNSVHEFWGTDDHGSAWRVHVLIEDVD